MKTKKFILLLAVIVLGGAIWAGVAQAQPKNIIFFIGDGMGFEHVKAGGMYRYGEAGTLSFELFPYNGQVTTYSEGTPGNPDEVTDSAAAGTALATGYKVYNGVVSVARPANDDYEYDEEMETLLEYFKTQGKRTGLVTTSFMTDATPAAFGAHDENRSHTDAIADDYRLQTVPNVLFGGGGYGMTDGEFANEGYTVKTCWDVSRDNIPDEDGLKWLDTETENMVLGRFGTQELPYEDDGLGDLPHLSEMTDVALKILDNDPDGFFLMVEGGLIDKASHRAKNEPSFTHKMILEMVEFDNAVQEAIDWAAGRTDTLILVTADHETGGLTDVSNNGQGNDPNVTWLETVHTAANVPVYAWGVNGQMICGTMDNTNMFEVCTADADCFPSWHQDYLDWVSLGKPNCWCYLRQCHGDTDNQKEGSPKSGYYYVHYNDLNVLLAGWNILEPATPPTPSGPGIVTCTAPNGVPCVCADFEHDQEGSYKSGYYRVHFNDLNTLIASWSILEPALPPIPSGPGIPPNCLNCQRVSAEQQKEKVEPLKIEQLIKWLEQLWLDEEARKLIDEDAWLKFIESLMEEIRN